MINNDRTYIWMCLFIAYSISQVLPKQVIAFVPCKLIAENDLMWQHGTCLIKPQIIFKRETDRFVKLATIRRENICDNIPHKSTLIKRSTCVKQYKIKSSTIALFVVKMAQLSVIVDVTELNGLLFVFFIFTRYNTFPDIRTELDLDPYSEIEIFYFSFIFWRFL